MAEDIFVFYSKFGSLFFVGRMRIFSPVFFVAGVNDKKIDIFNGEILMQELCNSIVLKLFSNFIPSNLVVSHKTYF